MKLQRRRGLGVTVPGRIVRAGRGGPGEEPPRRAGPLAGRVKDFARNHRRRLLGISGLTVLGFAVGYFVAAWWIFPAGGDGTDLRLLDTPDLLGRPVADASARLEELGLEPVLVAGIRHSSVEPGEIVAQSPLAGQPIQRGDSVRLTPSRGPEMRRVPDLAGLSASQATLVLETLGFETSTRVVPSTTANRGVQGTQPAAGETVALPSEVELLVGEGPQVAVVPDLRGRHVDDVEPLLRDQGLRLGDVVFIPEATEAPGRVIGQSPPAGFSLRGGDQVSIEVAGSAGESGVPEGPVPELPPDSTAPASRAESRG